MAQDDLTKETFKEIFHDNFEMTNYAINQAQSQINSGNDELNVTELLHEIRRNPPKPVEEEVLTESLSEGE